MNTNDRTNDVKREPLVVQYTSPNGISFNFTLRGREYVIHSDIHDPSVHGEMTHDEFVVHMNRWWTLVTDRAASYIFRRELTKSIRLIDDKYQMRLWDATFTDGLRIYVICTQYRFNVFVSDDRVLDKDEVDWFVRQIVLGGQEDSGERIAVSDKTVLIKR